MLQNFKSSIKEFPLYIIAAICSAMSDLFVFFALVYLDVSILYSQVAARLVGGGVSFCINRNYSFSTPDSNGSVTIQLRRFVLLYVVSLSLPVFLLDVLHTHIGIVLLVAKPLTDFTCMIFNFFVMKYYIYRSVIGFTGKLQGLTRKVLGKP